MESTKGAGHSLPAKPRSIKLRPLRGQHRKAYRISAERASWLYLIAQSALGLIALWIFLWVTWFAFGEV